ncbi:MAG TPA: SRPBCC family protein [Polyangiaceae bacterium]|nr:SRPBCC family protein [Polyangiaceae bacterium]
MLKKLAIAVGLVVVVFIAVVVSRPSHFHIERTARTSAPPEAVFPLINDFHRWSSWSPWEKLDPNLKREYSGEPQGKGAVYDWTGNDEVGTGRMRIIDSEPARSVTISLEFKKPFEATNAALFSINPDGVGSRVTWGMDGESNFMFKAVGLLFMNMDEMVGKDFESGLDNLSRAAEAEATKAGSATPAAAEAAPAGVGATPADNGAVPTGTTGAPTGSAPAPSH